MRDSIRFIMISLNETAKTELTVRLVPALRQQPQICTCESSYS
jgi:hypothetical protein